MSSVRRAAGIALLVASTGCLTNPFEGQAPDHGSPRLQALPRSEPEPAPATGTLPLGLGSPRDGVLFVPASYDPAKPMPLALVLHGATGAASNMLPSHQQLADSLGIILLGIDSRAYTWDAIIARFSYDIDFIDLALADIVRRYAVDRSRLGVIGFSDGASYALALGLANGDIFRKVILHSPGIRFRVRLVGSPAFYVAHGRNDEILPVEGTRLAIVPFLRAAGREVQYVEWDGPHAISMARIRESLIWLAAR